MSWNLDNVWLPQFLNGYNVSAGTYVAVIARKQPQCIPDFLAYQTIIIESQMEYQGEAWMEYDCRICQRATTNLHISWSAIDTTLWNLVFAWKAKQPIAAISLIHKIKPMTTTKCPIVSQFAKKGILTGIQVAHLPIVLITMLAADPQVMHKMYKGIFCPNHPQRGTQ